MHNFRSSILSKACTERSQSWDVQHRGNQESWLHLHELQLTDKENQVFVFSYILSPLCVGDVRLQQQLDVIDQITKTENTYPHIHKPARMSFILTLPYTILQGIGSLSTGKSHGFSVCPVGKPFSHQLHLFQLCYTALEILNAVADLRLHILRVSSTYTTV